MNNLTKRTITGVLIILYIIGSIIIGKITFYFLGVLLTYLALREFFLLTTKDQIKPFHHYGAFLGILIFTMFYIYCQKIVDEKIFLPLVPLIISIFLIELYRKNKRPFHNIAYTIFGLIYLAIPVSLFNFFVFQGEFQITYLYKMLLFYFILVWSYDTLAYISGMLIGKTHLFPRISPKKTWEGLIGGSIGTIGISILLSTFYKDLSVYNWIIIAIIIIIGGTFGDLTESLYKRSINTKESGNILPGHGGVLDRFDAIFLSAPLVFTYLKLIS